MSAMQATMQEMQEKQQAAASSGDVEMAGEQHQEVLARFDQMEARLSQVEKKADESDERYSDIQSMLKELVAAKRAKTAQDGK